MPTVTIDENAEQRFHNDTTADLLDARAAVASLATSCRIALSLSASDRRLGRAACYIFEVLVAMPGMFRLPKPISNAELARNPILLSPPRMIEHSMQQLEACGLIRREGHGDDQKVKLLAPAWAMEFHEQRLKDLWTLDRRSGQHMTFERGCAFWTAFMEGCPGPVA